jgi:hypothetical protein
MAKTATKERFKPASAAEAERQLFLVRNGLNIEHGFALDFSRRDPVLKMTPDYLKEVEGAAEENLKSIAALEDETAKVADILAPIEGLATAPRSVSEQPPTTQDLGRGNATREAGA